MREHLESAAELHRVVGRVTLAELTAATALVDSVRIHTSHRHERVVTAVQQRPSSSPIPAGALVLHGAGPLDWQFVRDAGTAGAAAVVLPVSWPGRTSPMLTALAEAQRLAVFAVPASTNWPELYAECVAAARRLGETARLAPVPSARTWGASALRQLLEGERSDAAHDVVEPGAAVFAFAPVQGSFVPGSGDEALDRALWLAMLDPDIPSDAEGVRIGSTAYVVMRLARSEADQRTIAEHIRRLCSVTLDRPVLAAIGCAAATPADLVASREEADRVLALARRRTTAGTATLTDVQHLALLEEAAAVLNAQPHLMSQKLATLRRSDATRNTSYITVLRAFLDNFGDVNTSAERLGMHHNTFRYRLKRAVEVAGINLEDPAERLALQVELAVGG